MDSRVSARVWWPWMLWPLAFVAGLALLEGRGRPMANALHVGAMVWGLGLAAGSVWARGRALKGAWGPRLACAAAVSGVLGVALMGWGWGGWRLASAMSETLPASWIDRPVRVEVMLDSLAEPGPGGWSVEARVLQWQGPWASGETNKRANERANESANESANAPQPEAGVLPVRGLPRRIQLRMPGLPQEPLAGEHWQVVVQLHPPDGLSNPGGRDAGLRALSRGVGAVGRVVVNHHVPAPVMRRAAGGAFRAGWVDRLRSAIRARLQARLQGSPATGVLAGLSIGDQAAVSARDWDAFRRTGLAHLLAVSGAHIVMVGAWVAWGVRRAWARWPAGVHRWPAHVVARWASLLVCVAYAALTGWGLPAQRTIWMMAAFAALRTAGLRWPWPLVWAWSAVLVLVLDPWALWQAGFWLSYVAVGVLMASPRREAVGDVPAASWRSGLADLLRVQWRLSWALAPLSLVCFHQVSVIGLVANLIAIPLATTVCTPLALIGVLCPPAWTLDAFLLSPCLRGLYVLASGSGAIWTTAEAPAWLSFGMVGAGVLLVCPMPWRWRGLAAPWLMAGLCLPPSWHVVPPPAPGHFLVLAADVGQGSAVLVQTARHLLLFDTGPRWGPDLDAGKQVLLPLLQTMGAGPIDRLVISHEDTDHVGGAASVVAGWPVRELMSTLPLDHPLRGQPGMRGQPLPHRPCVAGQSWVWDGVAFEVLHPRTDVSALPQGEDEARGEANAHACVLRVAEVGGASPASVLLAADIEAAQEAALVSAPASMRSGEDGGRVTLRSTVLVAPHHGSQTSSTQAFLQAVAPQQVVIQVARRNRYGHPAPAVLARYEAMGLPWVASPDCGAFIWDSSEVVTSSPDGLARVGHCWRTRRSWFGPSVGRAAPAGPSE